MRDENLAPDRCSSMSEVRAGIDRLDEAVVALLAERFRYMEAAARIKPQREAVRDERRKADVLAKVRASAERAGAPAERIAAVYEQLIENSIAYEFERFDAIRA